jgi:hypothetical protein
VRVVCVLGESTHSAGKRAAGKSGADRLRLADRR